MEGGEINFKVRFGGLGGVLDRSLREDVGRGCCCFEENLKIEIVFLKRIGRFFYRYFV